MSCRPVTTVQAELFLSGFPRTRELLGALDAQTLGLLELGFGTHRTLRGLGLRV